MSWRNLKVAPEGTHHERVTGQAAYGPRFDEVLSFHAPGLAAVRRDGAAWHIRPDGTAAYARRFARTFGFYDRLAAVMSKDGWHHVTPSGDDAYRQRQGPGGGARRRGPRPVADPARGGLRNAVRRGPGRRHGRRGLDGLERAAGAG